MNIDDEQQEKKIHTLESLPHPILTEIASYLSGRLHKSSANSPTRNTGGDTLLAVALTASKSSWDKLRYDDTTDIDTLLSPASKAVIDDWGEKFVDFNFNHARYSAGFSSKDAFTNISGLEYLDDIDLKAILICMDARYKVKSLKLNWCYNITGRGLEPLAGSTVIEKIDLSLVSGDYSMYSIDLEKIKLSEGTVLPILHSIIEGGSSALRHIQLPLKWRKSKSTELVQFLEDYDDHLERLNRVHTCQHEWEEDGVVKKCENNCAMGMQGGARFGIQTATCYKCLKCFCTEEDCIEVKPSFDYCPLCQKYHCNDCNLVFECSKCDKSSCQDCYGVDLCHVCYEAFCMGCRHVGTCSECYKSVCESCGPIQYCSSCQECFCDDHHLTQCMSCEEDICNGCIGQLLEDGDAVCEGCYNR